LCSPMVEISGLEQSYSGVECSFCSSVLPFGAKSHRL
jgi:hypothetical protein